jgi:hypothetical protein
VLDALRARGLDPKALPVLPRGKLGHRGAIEAEVVPSKMSKRNFRRAWEDLRNEREIADLVSANTSPISR